MNMSGMKKGPNSGRPELLSPAGSEDALRAALAGGADAVYFGGAAFSNRMRAKNFTDDGLTEAIRTVHAAGARAHITVNTRVRDREMDDALRLAERILGGPEEERADAVIIADLGLMAQIRKRWPHAVFHASTQTSLGSPADCRRLAELGASRLVVPRELNREEIAELVNGPLEIEIFIHGAHCVSCSGQCLMSYFCGGRSGNRGECAQPCRLPYRVDCGEAGGGETGKSAKAAKTPAGRSRAGTSELPLSLADMCLAGRIADVIALGVASLKIEGRLKSASYVYGVTRVYRRLLDEGRDAEPEEIRELAALFTRGFTDGYYEGRYGSMSGTTAREDPRAAASDSAIAKAFGERMRSRAAEREAEAAVPVSAVFTMKRDEPVSLVLTAARDGEPQGRAEGDVPAEAAGRPTDAESAARSLTKLGGTGFALRQEDIRCALDEGLWMPASKLNDLRRRAAEDLRAAIDALGSSDPFGPSGPSGADQAQPRRGFSPYVLPASDSGCGSGLSGMDRERVTLELADARLLSQDPRASEKLLRQAGALFVPWDQLTAAADALDRLGDPADLPPLCPVLPVFPLSDEALRRASERWKAAGVTRILAHGIGAAELTGDFAVDLSFRGNVTNAAAAEVYRKAGFSNVGLSPELPAGAVRALGKLFPVSCVAYGRVPVMTLARCVLKEKNRSCVGRGGRLAAPRKTEYCRGTLTDRMGEVFPVYGTGDCVDIVYNAKPIWMGDRLDELGDAELRFLWTTESAAEMLSVFERYRRGGPGEGRRIP